MIWSEKVYIVTKFNLSSFFWHQLQDVLDDGCMAKYERISNGDVKTESLLQNMNLRAR